MNEQFTFADCFGRPFQIDKPIRLIELFAGIGAQAQALNNIGANFEHWRAVEIDVYAMKSYNAIHGTDFKPSDITKLRGGDLGITETAKYCYIVTYSFPCQLTGFIRSRQSEGHGKGEWYSKRFALGSGKAA